MGERMSKRGPSYIAFPVQDGVMMTPGRSVYIPSGLIWKNHMPASQPCRPIDCVLTELTTTTSYVVDLAHQRVTVRPTLHGSRLRMRTCEPCTGSYLRYSRRFSRILNKAFPTVNRRRHNYYLMTGVS